MPSDAFTPAAAEALSLLRRLTELLREAMTADEREIIKAELEVLAERL